MKKIILLLIALGCVWFGVSVYAQTESADTLITNIQTKIKERTLEEQKSVWIKLKLKLGRIYQTKEKAIINLYIKRQVTNKIVEINAKIQERTTEELDKKVETITIPADEVGKVDPSLKTIGTVRALMIDSVNTQRKNGSLSGVKINTLLNEVAQKHAEYMAKTQDFAHITKSGNTPADRVVAVGYNYRAVGENIAYGQRSVTEVMNSWMKSEGHKANIMNKEYKELGVGYASGYWVQVFGTQMAK